MAEQLGDIDTAAGGEGEGAEGDLEQLADQLNDIESAAGGEGAEGDLEQLAEQLNDIESASGDESIDDLAEQLNEIETEAGGDVEVDLDLIAQELEEVDEAPLGGLDNSNDLGDDEIDFTPPTEVVDPIDEIIVTDPFEGNNTVTFSFDSGQTNVDLGAGDDVLTVDLGSTCRTLPA